MEYYSQRSSRSPIEATYFGFCRVGVSGTTNELQLPPSRSPDLVSNHAGKANDSHSQRIRRRISIDSRQENIRPHSNSVDPRVLHVRLLCPRKWAQQRDLQSEKASIGLSALPKHIRHVIQSNQLGRPSNPETVRG